jgi:type IV secretion system protein VirB10
MPGSVHGPKKMTIMEGTAVSAVTVDAATSDSPGQLVMQISSNVYDDMTGQHLLIPAGTRLVTKYDTAVSIGQDRIGTIGQRLIFPDTSSRQLGAMQMADMTGEAGLHDVLNTHFWQKFGTALTVAIIGAGLQLSQTQQSAFATPSASSAATGAFTQQLGQFGMAQAQSAMNIPNTIELRSGLQVLLKFNKDLTLPEYHDARMMPASGVMTFGKAMQ